MSLALAACGGEDADKNPPPATATQILTKDAACDSPGVRRLLEISVHADDEEYERNSALIARCNQEQLERDRAARGANDKADVVRREALSQPTEQTLNFESPHVHPLELTPDGNTLLAVNTAAHTLDVFAVSGSTLTPVRSIPVGLDPVSVRARSNTQAWVVNHVADTISVVDLTAGTVVQTLDTLNEPTDVVFAGSPVRAFVTASKANKVNVYDAANPAGVARQTLNIVGLNPRALAASPNGSTVYAAIFESGNGTRLVNGVIVRDTVLADNDVAVINANTLAVTYQKKLMTMVMGIAVNPVNNQVSVVGTELTNDVVNEPTLNGIFARTRLATFTPGTAAIRDLNPHLTYSVRNIGATARTQSLADPRGIAWRSSGTQAFVTGMGSNNVAVIDAAGARLGQFDVGAGPTGLVLKDAANLGFVLNRFDATISVIDLNARSTLNTTPFFDPTPQAVKKGRRFLFDARLTSGLGQASCASCHVDGRTDRLAWDLSNAAAPLVSVPVASNSGVGAPTGGNVTLNGTKGPMVTQTLIDIMGFPRFHWRGDRARIDDFNGAFTGLLAGDRGLTSTEMADFKAYLSTLWLQPNPYRRIDDTRPSSVVLPDGRTVSSPNMTSLRGNNPTSNNCLGCHSGQGNATRNFGVNAEIGSNVIAPSLPGLYNKLGQEQSLSGFAYFHNGSAGVDQASRLSTTERNPAFLAEIMSLEGPSGPLVGAEQRNAPHAGIGKGLTANGALTSTQSSLLAQIQSIAQSSPFAELVAHVLIDGVQRGFVYQGNNSYRSDAAADATWTQAQLLAHAAAGRPVTFMLVAQGTETRIALDRDLDGVLNFDEIAPAVPVTAIVGAAGGAAFTDPVAGGQWLTGVTIKSGYWIDSIQGLATPGNLPPHGGQGGAADGFTLDAGEYIVRAYGKQGANAVSPAISQISFVTNRGRVFGPYGEGLGQDPTTPFDIVLPPGGRAVGFAGRAGTFLNAIGLLYLVDQAPPTVASSPIVGAAGGTAFADPTVSGQQLTGVTISAGYWIDAIQGLATPSHLPRHGGAGGNDASFSLPAGEYLVRVFGKQGGNAVSPAISQINFMTNTGRVFGPYGEGLGQDPTAPFDIAVPAGGRVVGFTGRAGNFLNAIGVLYVMDVAPPAPRASPIFGASFGTAFTDTVGAGQVLTGVGINTGYWIDAIQALATPVDLPKRGGGGGEPNIVTLLPGEHLVRMYGRTGSNAVVPSVSQISFVSSTGRVFGPYGEGLGQDPTTPFDFTVPVGSRIVGFTGRAGEFLHAIGVLYLP